MPSFSAVPETSLTWISELKPTSNRHSQKGSRWMVRDELVGAADGCRHGVLVPMGARGCGREREREVVDR